MFNTSIIISHDSNIIRSHRRKLKIQSSRSGSDRGSERQVAVEGGVVVGGPVVLVESAEAAAVRQPPQRRVLGLGVRHRHREALHPLLETGLRR